MLRVLKQFEPSVINCSPLQDQSRISLDVPHVTQHNCLMIAHDKKKLSSIIDLQMTQHKMCPQEVRQVLRPCIFDLIESKVEPRQIGEGRQCLDQVSNLLVGPSTTAEPWCLFFVSRASSWSFLRAPWTQHSVGLSMAVCVKLLTSSILVDTCVTCGQTRVLAAASQHHDPWLLDGAASLMSQGRH